jgi:hypothetical protein
MLKRTGSSMQEAESSVAGLTKKLFDAAKGTGEAKVALKMLDVQVLDNTGNLRNNEEVFTEIVTKLSKMENVATRNGLAFAIFGRQADVLIPLLDEFDGSLDKTLKKFDKLGPKLEAASAAASEYSDHIQDMSTAMDVAKATLFTGTIQRLSDTLNLIKNSQIGDILYIVASVIVRALNMIIDAVNVVLGTITSTISTIVYNYKASIFLFIKLYLKLIETINNNPIGDRLISSEHLQSVRKTLNDFQDMTWDSQEKMTNSWKQTLQSLKQLATFGGTLKRPSVPKTGGTESPPFPPTTDKDTKTEDFGSHFDYVSSANILKQFEDLKYEYMKDGYAKQLVLLEKEEKEKLYLIKENVAKGTLVEDDAVKATVALNEWKAAKLKQIEEEQYKLRKQATVDFVKSTNDMFKQVNNNIKESLSSFKGTESDPYTLLQVNSWVSATYNIQEAVMKMGDNIADNMKSIGDMTLTMFDTIGQVMDLNLEKRLDIIEKEKLALDTQYNNDKNRLDNIRMGRRRHDELMSRLDKKKQDELDALNKRAEEETKKAAKKAIELQLLQAAAAGGLASMQLWADPNMNYYAKIGFQVGLAVQTTATMALIASQLSKFATGGIVKGNNTSGDNELVRVNSGEMILNRRQQTELFNIANGRNINKEATNIVINQTIGNNVDSYMLQEANNKQIESLRIMLETMNHHGSLAPIIRNAI